MWYVSHFTYHIFAAPNISQFSAFAMCYIRTILKFFLQYLWYLSKKTQENILLQTEMSKNKKILNETKEKIELALQGSDKYKNTTKIHLSPSLNKINKNDEHELVLITSPKSSILVFFFQVGELQDDRSIKTLFEYNMLDKLRTRNLRSFVRWHGFLTLSLKYYLQIAGTFHIFFS